jgi:hypothetical protein
MQENIPEILVCFDTDGIFRCMDYYTDDEKTWFESGQVAGPLDPSDIRNHIGDVADMYIVSESPFYPKHPDKSSIFPIQNDLPSRYINLIECYNKYWTKFGQDPKQKWYVSDNNDYVEATKAEFEYIRHDRFIDRLKAEGMI